MKGNIRFIVVCPTCILFSGTYSTAKKILVSTIKKGNHFLAQFNVGQNLHIVYCNIIVITINVFLTQYSKNLHTKPFPLRTFWLKFQHFRNILDILQKTDYRSKRVLGIYNHVTLYQLFLKEYLEESLKNFQVLLKYRYSCMQLFTV